MLRRGARAGAREGLGREEGWGRGGRIVVVVLEGEEEREENTWMVPVELLIFMLKPWACVLLVVLTATERPKLAGGGRYDRAAPLPLPPI